MKRRKGIRWDYNLDGMAKKEIVKGVMKKYWRKWYKRLLKNRD